MDFTSFIISPAFLVLSGSVEPRSVILLDKVAKIFENTFLYAGEIYLSKALNATVTFSTEKSIPGFIQVENKFLYAIK